MARVPDDFQKYIKQWNLILIFNLLVQNEWTLMCWCRTRQVTSHRIGYSEFIPHSLLHSHNSQSHNYNYCHLQHHNYLSCSYCHSLDTAQLVAAGLHWTQWFHRLYQRFVQPQSRLWVSLVVCCVLLCSARGGHFSKGLAGYNICHVQQFLKNTCSAY
jgi:uncharacterized membrane protein YidH (DUF202 family)